MPPKMKAKKTKKTTKKDHFEYTQHAPNLQLAFALSGNNSMKIGRDIGTHEGFKLGKAATIHNVNKVIIKETTTPFLIRDNAFDTAGLLLPLNQKQAHANTFRSITPALARYNSSINGNITIAKFAKELRHDVQKHSAPHSFETDVGLLIYREPIYTQLQKQPNEMLAMIDELTTGPHPPGYMEKYLGYEA